MYGPLVGQTEKGHFCIPLRAMNQLSTCPYSLFFDLYSLKVAEILDLGGFASETVSEKKLRF